MYEFIASEIRTVTPKEAQSLLRYNTYKGQRNIKRSHVDDLADRMKKGMFTTGTVCMALINGSEAILMDGQHTLHAAVKSNITINIVLERVRCYSDKDLSLLYQQKDGGISRSLRDYVVAEKTALGVDWQPPTTSLIVSAISIINKSSHRSKSKRVESLEHYIEDGNFVVKILGGKRAKDNSHLWRAPIISVMILTYRSNQILAESFWGKVRSGEMLKSDDPQFLLREFLMSHSSANKRLGKPIATNHEFIYKSIYAWNAYLKNRKIKMIKYLPSYPIPELQ